MTARRAATFPLALVLLAAAGCAGADHRREVLFGLDGDDPVQRHLAEPARLSVVYWPAIEGCGPCELGVVRTLEEVQAAFGADTRVLTVVPPALGARFAERNRLEWPGTVVELDRSRYDQQRALGPLPRVEVWSAAGELLLLRSLPANLAAGNLLADEILWCRSFTGPLEEEGT